MKYGLFFFLLVPLCSFGQTENSLFTVDTLSVQEAPQHYGAYKTFCDSITAVHHMETTRGGVTLITLGKAPQTLVLVIWDEDAKKFPKALTALYHPGDRICVIGQISKFGNSPRLEVGTPRQIHKVQ